MQILPISYAVLSSGDGVARPDQARPRAGQDYGCSDGLAADESCRDTGGLPEVCAAALQTGLDSRVEQVTSDAGVP